MKIKTFIPVIIFIVFTQMGCKKIDKLTQFEMDYDESVVVPSTLGINLPFNILTPNIETNSESEFSINDTRKDLIEDVRLTSLILTVKSPLDEDFSFLKSINVYITAPGFPEVKVATKENLS